MGEGVGLFMTLSVNESEQYFLVHSSPSDRAERVEGRDKGEREGKKH